MRRHAFSSKLLPLILVAALLGGGQTPAVAVPAIECTTANQFNIDPPKYFHYEICGVPDIDQKKAQSGDVDGLPGDGACHCVPTSQANWLAYIANHGYPEIYPGPGNYQAGPPGSTDVYNRMTLTQGLLGVAMGTKSDLENDECGTNSSNAKTGTEAWLNSFGAGSDFSVVTVGGYPRLTHAVAQAHLGGLVRLSIGWYEFANADLSAIVRNGGHATSLVYSEGDLDDDEAVIGMHDPANDNDTTTQSLFTRDEYATNDMEVVVVDPKTGEATERVLSRIVDYGTGFLDGFSAIIPKFGLAPGPEGGLQALYPGTLTGHPRPNTGPLVPSSAGTVVDMAVVPHKSTQLVVLDNSDEISTIDRIGGRLTTFARLPGVRRVTFGGYDERVYALVHQVGTSSDRRGRIAGSETVTLVQFDLAGTELRRVPSAVAYQEIAFDPVQQRLLALDLRRGVIDAFSADLRPQGTVVAGLAPTSATGSLTVDPRNGTAWVHVDGTGTATRVDLPQNDGETAARAVQVRLGDGAALMGLHASDDGLLYASRNGTIVSFGRDGSRWGGTPFDGLSANGRLRLSWSYTNVAPGEESGPAYRNVLPQLAG